MRPRLFTFFSLCWCSVITCISQTSAAADAYWPGWLGPDRDGWVADFTPPERWPDNLAKTWQVNVGIGYGSPLVVADRVYQHSRQGENEVVSCLTLTTGKVIWKKENLVPFKARGGGEFHGTGPKSCPVVADGRLFTLSITGDLIAWSADSGERLWESNYGARYQQNHPHWGASTSPIVDGDRIFVHFGNDEKGELVALSVDDGSELWSLVGEGASYSSPLLAEIGSVRQLVEWNHESLVGVDVASGEKLWSYPFPHVTHNQNMPTPTFHDGRILLGAENRGLHSIEPRFVDGEWTVEKRWSQDKVALDMSSAVMNDGLLYGMSHYGKGRMFCVDPASGDIRWQSTGRFGQNAAFLSIPKAIVSLNDQGMLQIVNADPEAFEVAAFWRVSEFPTWAPPVLLKDGFLIKDQNTLVFWAFKMAPAE